MVKILGDKAAFIQTTDTDIFMLFCLEMYGRFVVVPVSLSLILKHWFMVLCVFLYTYNENDNC